MGELDNQKAQYSRVLQSSMETRMRAIQEKLSLAFTFCSTVEIEIKYGHSDRARELVNRLRSTVGNLTDHINDPRHVSGKQSREFREQLVQLKKRLIVIESLIEQR